jgi:lipopolysaccharide transport system permease protein
MASRPSGTHRIQPSRWLVPVDFRELWESRGLVRFFVLRDIKSRYRQTLIGPAWAIVRPFGSIVVFTVIFGHVAHIKTNTGIPYGSSRSVTSRPRSVPRARASSPTAI